MRKSHYELRFFDRTVQIEEGTLGHSTLMILLDNLPGLRQAATRGDGYTIRMLTLEPEGVPSGGISLRKIIEQTSVGVQIVSADGVELEGDARQAMLDRIVFVPTHAEDDLLAQIVVADASEGFTQQSLYPATADKPQNEVEEQWRSRLQNKPVIDKVKIQITEAALSKAVEHGRTDRREVGGFCMGCVVQHKECWEVIVTDTFVAQNAVSHSASFSFTPDTWSAAHKRVEAEYTPRGEYIVGWYHTHPNFGVFFSSMDHFVHENFFTQPWHVALVIDPYRRDEGFFAWSGSGRKATVGRCAFQVKNAFAMSPTGHKEPAEQAASAKVTPIHVGEPPGRENVAEPSLVAAVGAAVTADDEQSLPVSADLNIDTAATE